MKSKKKPWKIHHIDRECIETEGDILFDIQDIVTAHNEDIDELIGIITTLKQEIDHLKYNILIKSYDRTK